MISLIKKLVETPGPSGYESQVRELVRQEIAPYAMNTRVDALGNLLASRGEGQAGGKRIMVAAHMDEIGLIATHVDENGFIRFVPVGAVNRRTCVGSRVRFLDGTQGVIGHEYNPDDSKLPSFEQMYIDVGAKNRKGCAVRVGDAAVFDQVFASYGDRLVGKAMDDRVGIAILIETMRKLKRTPHQVTFVFSVQEEVGLRGATTAAYGLDPDIGVALDVTRSGDTPKGVKMEVLLGRGPAVKVRDSGMLSDPRVIDWMVSTAKRERIPYQLEVLETGTTDARAIQLTRAGVPAGCISIPCRYIHAPSEMVDLNDVMHAVDLMVALLTHSVELP